LRLVRLPGHLANCNSKASGCLLLLYCYKVQNRENFPMLKTTACLLFAGAASTAALPLSLGLAAAGAAALLLDHHR